MRRALLVGLASTAGIGPALAGLDVPPSAPDTAVIAAQVETVVRQMMPAPASGIPPATTLDGARGSSPAYARGDHTHKDPVQRTVLVTAADGTATWIFARPIPVPAGKLPPVAYMVEDTGTPVDVQVVGRAMTGDGTTDTHTAVTIRARRSRTLPATLASLMALVSFDVFGLAASGVRVNLFAADPTQ